MAAMVVLALAACFINYTNVEREFVSLFHGTQTGIAQLRAKDVRHWLHQRRSALISINVDSAVRKYLARSHDERSPLEASARALLVEVEQHLQSLIAQGGFIDISIHDAEDLSIIAQRHYRGMQVANTPERRQAAERGQRQSVVTDVFPSPEPITNEIGEEATGVPSAFLALPLPRHNGPVAIAVARLNLFELYGQIEQASRHFDFLGSSDIYLVNSSGRAASPLQFEATLRQQGTIQVRSALEVIMPNVAARIAKHFSHPTTGLQSELSEPYPDYRGVMVLGALQKVEDSPWYVVFEVDADEAFAPLRQVVGGYILLGGILFAGIPLMGILVTDRSARELKNAVKSARAHAKTLQLNWENAGAAASATEHAWAILPGNPFKRLFAPLEPLATELELLLSDLVASSQAQLLLLENSGDFIYKHDTLGVFTYISPSVERITGYAANEWRRSYTEFLTDSSLNAEAIKRTEHALKTGEPSAPYLVEIYSASREKLILEIREHPYYSSGKIAGIIGTASDVTAKIRFSKEAERLRQAVNAAAEMIVITDRSGNIQEVNPAFTKITGYSRDEALGQNMRMLKSGTQDDEFYRGLWSTISAGKQWSGKIVNRRKNGDLYTARATIAPIRDAGDQISGHIAIQQDITDLEAMEIRVMQAQRLESIGALAAGIAHEINSPMQFVANNTCFLRDEFANIDTLLKSYEQLLGNLELQNCSGADTLLRSLADVRKSIDINYLRDEIPRAIAQSLEGIKRVTEIVAAMRTFAYRGTPEKKFHNLNEIINHALTVSSYKWKHLAEIDLALDENLPQVPCIVGEISQVLLNLIVNAADSIQEELEAHQRDGKGIIRIATKRKNAEVAVSVSDTGAGISPEIIGRIFDPFFTTKEVGKGTGQGLAIVYSTIVEKHRGAITVDNLDPHGAIFSFTLPLEA